MADQNPFEGLAPIAPAVDKYKTNRALIDDKKAKATAALSVIKKVDTPEEDEFAAKLLVKCGATLTSMENLRKEYTKLLNDFIKDEIKPENELKLEMGRVKGLRDTRANGLAAAAKAASDKIAEEVEHNKTVHEIKGKLKLHVDEGIQGRIADFDNAINENLKKGLTPENGKAFADRIAAIKPSMKQEVYEKLFQIDRTKILKHTDAQFAEALEPCKGYFTYERVSGTYQDMAEALRDSWVQKIPAKVQELKRLAKGGEDAAKLQERINQRDIDEKAERDRIAEKNRKEAETRITNETNDAKLSEDFKGQVKTQGVASAAPKNTRTMVYYTLEPNISLVKIAHVVSSMIINMISTPEAQLKQVYKKESEKPEDVEYVEGIQYWLNQMATLGYTPKIEGLVRREKLITVAKK